MPVEIVDLEDPIVISSTGRTCSPELETILKHQFDVLDHGFIRVIDYMGTEELIAQAARLSYKKGTKRSRDTKGLIRYLARNRHTSPTEMAEIVLHVKLPIFVARQWIRHRMASVNEMSARYSILDKEFYIPSPEHLATQSKTNRQGRGDVLGGEEAERVLHILKTDSTTAYDHYEEMLNERDEQQIDSARDGLARELSRMNLSLNYYTQWYWKTDAHNLLHFLSLRMDHHAQYEIRAYADIIGNEIVAKWLPLSWQAFLDFRKNALTLSALDVQILQAISARKSVRAVAESFGWLKRNSDGRFGQNSERDECAAKLLKLGFNVNWDE